MHNYWGSFYGPGGMMPFNGWFLGIGGVFVGGFIVWSLIWKGLALWKAARAGEKTWFVVLLIVNTLGILEILYIYIFSEKAKSPKEEHHNHHTTGK